MKFRSLLVILVAFFFIVGTAVAIEVKEPVGTVSIESKALAVGIGFQWGSGVLTIDGKKYNFKVKGLNVLDIGYTGVSAVGHVYNLNRVSDFGGTYTTGEIGFALAGGIAGLTMKNQNGVVMSMSSTQQGVRLTLAGGGLKVTLR